MSSVTIEQFLAACETWNLEEVHHAVETGFLVDTFDDDHVTGLQMAAATGNIGIVCFYLFFLKKNISNYLLFKYLNHFKLDICKTYTIFI